MDISRRKSIDQLFQEDGRPGQEPAGLTEKEEDDKFDVEAGNGKHLEEQERKQKLEQDQQLPITRIVTAQDWTGPNDEENPLNWPTWIKIWHVVLSATYAFAATIGSSTYSPAVSDIVKDFNVSQTTALLGITMYVLGIGLGPVIAAPLSETFGRRIVYWISLPISMLFTLGVGLSQNFASILVLRFLAGSFGSAVLSVGAGTNADIFPPKTRAYSTIWFLLSPFSGTTIGTTVGGFAAQYKGWRWTQWEILFVGTAVWLSSFTMRESYKKMILRKRAKQFGLEPPKDQLPPGFGKIKMILTIVLFRPIHMLIFEPIVTFLALYSAFLFGVLFIFLPAFNLVFQEVYGFNISQAGLAYIPLTVGYILAAFTTLACDYWLYRKQHDIAAKKGKQAAPEHRLYSAMMGSFGVTIGLFWFAWTARREVHWIVPMLGNIPFAWGTLSIFAASILYSVDVYGALNGASSIAANGFLRYIFAATFPLFTIPMYRKLDIHWATSLLAFLSLLMLPIPWILFKFGKQIRSKSHYPTM